MKAGCLNSIVMNDVENHVEPPVDDDVVAAWELEIDRRCAALDSGEAVTSDWNEFKARIERDVFGR